jgi:hypothetical protein
MTLAGYRKNGWRKRSNLQRVKQAAKKLFAPQPVLTMQQLRQAGQDQAKEKL